MRRLNVLKQAESIKKFIIAEMVNLEVETDLGMFKVTRAEFTDHGRVLAVDFKSSEDNGGVFFYLHTEIVEGFDLQVFLDHTNVSAGVDVAIATLRQLTTVVQACFVR